MLLGGKQGRRNPLFARPLDLHSKAAETPSPHLLADGLALLPRSPALAKGNDSATLPGLPKEVAADLKKHIYADFAGNSRPEGGPFDLGAYHSSQANTSRHAERNK